MRTSDECKRIENYYAQYGLQQTMAHFGLNKNQVLGVVKRVRDVRKKYAEKFTPERLRKLRGAAMKVLRGYDREVAEDFGSYVLIHALQGRKIDLNNLKVDFFREQFGRDGEKKCVEEAIEISAPPSYDLLVIADQLKLAGNERAVFVLAYKWGLNQNEVGEVLGVTAARICQIESELRRKFGE